VDEEYIILSLPPRFFNAEFRLIAFHTDWMEEGAQGVLYVAAEKDWNDGSWWSQSAAKPQSG
jgi:hypothetical protein